MTALIETKDVSYTYPDGTRALSGVSVRIEESKIYALLGPNGSGKSTLLLLLAGLLKPKSGEVLYRGEPVEKAYNKMRREIGIVFQDPDDQLFAPTVREDIEFGPKQLGLGGVQDRVERVARTLMIEDILERPPYRLSGGEKKKVALATVLVMDTPVLLLDEPFAELASDAAESLERLLKGMRGRTIIFTGHDPDAAARLAEEVLILKDGRLVAKGRPEEVLTDESLMNPSGLSLPLPARIYKMLGGRGRPPITLEGLVERLKAEQLIKGFDGLNER